MAIYTTMMKYVTKEQYDSLSRFGKEILEDLIRYAPKKLQMMQQDGSLYPTLKKSGDQMLDQYLDLLDAGYQDNEALEVVREIKYQITSEEETEE